MEKRILVIDDEHGFREMMKDHLTSEEFDVDYAAQLIVVTERVMCGDYDLITLDLNLDEFHGADVWWSPYRDTTVDTPVVVISGYLNQDSRGKLEMSYMLEKTCRKSELLNLMSQAMDGAPSTH